MIHPTTSPTDHASAVRYHGWYHEFSSGESSRWPTCRKPASEAGFPVVGATGFEPATFRPQPSGSGCRCVRGRPDLPMRPRFVDDLDVMDEASGTPGGGDSRSLRLGSDAKRAADGFSCRCHSGRMRWHRRLGSTTEGRSPQALCHLFGQASLLRGRGSTRPAASLDLGHGADPPSGAPLPPARRHRLGALAPLSAEQI